MISPIRAAIGWLLQKFWLFVIIALILVVVQWMREDLAPLNRFDSLEIQRQLQQSLSELVPKKAESEEFRSEKLRKLQKRRDALQRLREDVESETCVLSPACSLTKQSKIYRYSFEISAVDALIGFGKGLPPDTCAAAARRGLDCMALDSLLRDLDEAKPFYAPREKRHKETEVAVKECHAHASMQSRLCAQFRSISDLDLQKLLIDEQALLDERSQAFLAAVREVQSKKDQIFRRFVSVIPVAASILATIIALPILYRASNYFGVGPLVKYARPVKLDENACGTVRVLAAPNTVQRIHVPTDTRLMIQPSTLRGLENAESTRTRWLLDYRMPLTSIAAQLYMLTEVQSGGSLRATLGSDDGSDKKFGIYELTAGGCLSLHPRCVAGLIVDADKSVRVTRHWRIWSLGSWLSLRFRYLVFHGPVILVLKGNRGIDASNVTGAATIDKRATLGFSCNLGYSVERTETFLPYLKGEKPLFRDRFIGFSGVYLHESQPRDRTAGNPVARVIGDLVNAILEAFGI